MAELSMQEDQESGKLVFESTARYQIWAISFGVLLPTLAIAGTICGVFPAWRQQPLSLCIFVLALFGGLIYWLVAHPKTQLIFDPKLSLLTKTEQAVFGEIRTTVLGFKEMAALQVVATRSGYSLIVINSKGKETRLNYGINRDEILAHAKKVSSTTGASIKGMGYRLWPV